MSSETGQTSPPNRSRSQPVKALLLLLKVAIPALLLWWMIDSGRLELDLLGALRPSFSLFCAITCLLAAIVVSYARWIVLLAAIGLRLPVREHVRIFLTGIFVSIVVPASMGMDGMRVHGTINSYPDRKLDAVLSIITDRVIGLVGLSLTALVFGVALLFSQFEPAIARAGVAIVGAVLLVVILSWLAYWLSKRLGWLDTLAKRPRLAQLGRALSRYRDRPGQLAVCLAMASAAHAGVGLAVFAGFRSLGTAPNVLLVLALTPIIDLAAMVPIAPLGLGVSDSIGEELYAVFSVMEGAEVTMLMRALVVGWCIVGAVGFLIPITRVGGNSSGATPQTEDP